MKFLPVAAPTASAICTMSASLKFGVMRWLLGCCARASELTALSRTPSEAPSASARNRWDNPVIVIFKTFLGAGRAARAIDRAAPRRPPSITIGPIVLRYRLAFRGRLRRPVIATADECLRFLSNLGHLQSEILLPSASHHRDVCLARGTQGVENLLAPRRIIQRRSVDGEHEVAWPQTDTRKRLAVATGVNAEASLFALSEHGLRTDDFADRGRNRQAFTRKIGRAHV